MCGTGIAYYSSVWYAIFSTGSVYPSDVCGAVRGTAIAHASAVCGTEIAYTAAAVLDRGTTPLFLPMLFSSDVRL